MVYKKFYISITESDDIRRTDYEGNEISCEGFNFEVYPKENRTQKIDEFSAAVGFEKYWKRACPKPSSLSRIILTLRVLN